MTPSFFLSLFKNYCLFLLKQELAALEKQAAAVKEAEAFIQAIEIPK